MKSIFILLLAVFFIPCWVFGQSNYKTAYVITTKGDTLRGYIDYREWGSNPNAINFKSSVNEPVKKFTPDQISFFEVNKQESYRTYTGKISTDAVDPNHLSEGKDSSFKMATVFLKVMEKGEHVTLYSYTDDIKSRFYVQDVSDASPVELEYHLYFDLDYTDGINKTGRTVTDNGFMRQLFILADKYNVLNSALQRDIEHANYYASEILEIVSKINNISKEDYKRIYGSGSKANLFAGLGLNITTTNPSNGFGYQAAGGKSYTSFSPAVSFGADFFANPATHKLVFRIEMDMAAAQYKSNYSNKVLPYVPVTYSYNLLAVTFAPQIIYNFYNKENFKIYAGAGFSLSMHNFMNVKFGSQDGKTPAGNISAFDPSNFIKIAPYIVAKVGMQVSKHIDLFVNYFPDTDVSMDPYFKLQFHMTQVGLNYLFR